MPVKEAHWGNLPALLLNSEAEAARNLSQVQQDIHCCTGDRWCGRTTPLCWNCVERLVRGGSKARPRPHGTSAVGLSQCWWALGKVCCGSVVQVGVSCVRMAYLTGLAVKRGMPSIAHRSVAWEGKCLQGD
jgi:hypothetical protein